VTRVATLFIYILTIAILVISISAVPISAQSGAIRLEGTVWDPSGESLAGAVLTAVEEKTDRQSSAVSEPDGHYVFLALQPGIYTVTVKAKGFKDVIHRSMSLFSPGTVLEDFSIEVSVIDKEISPAELAGRNEAQIIDSFSNKQIDALPNLNRDLLSVLIYQPGVQIRSDDPGSSTVNGTRPAMNGFGMDGISTTNPVQPRLDSPIVTVNPDSISDLQIITSGAKAEYGRSGGAQFILTSNPGAKSWSGNVYDYFRDQNLDANDFFNNANKVARPAFTRNIFGGTLSGPAFGKKNRLFLNFEGNLTDQKISRNRTVLTSEAKLGLFRWFTPGSPTLNSYNILKNDPRNLGIDPAIAPILLKLPPPNNTEVGDGLNTAGYRFNNPADLNSQAVNLRFDRYISPNHQFFFRATWNRIDSTDLFNNRDASFPGEESGRILKQDLAFAGGLDWVINPQMINELRVGYIRPSTEMNNPARLTSEMLLANSWTNPLDPSFPRSYKSPVLEISDYLSHSMSLHTFKYGGSFRRTVLRSTDYTGAYPDVTFGPTMGNAPLVGPTGVSVISSASRDVFEKLYNDLLGRMESVQQTYNSSLTSVLPAGTPRNRDFAFNEFAGFIQDDWRILPNLTLNLGLRYEVSPSPKELNGFQSMLDPVSTISPSESISNFKLVQTDSWYDKYQKSFAPRAGFAWDPFGSGTLVIRGSYGMYYDRLIGAVTNFVDQNSYGFSQNVSLYPNATGFDVRLSDGIPVTTQPASLPLQPLPTRSSSIAVLDPNLRAPRVDEFHLTLEKRLLGAILEGSYVGTRGARLFQYLNLNQTKTAGDFLQSFQELRVYRNNGTPVPATNTLVRIFGSPMAAINAIGGSVLDSGQAGLGANTVDLNYYGKYAAAQVSDFYIRNFTQFNEFLYGSSSSKSWHDALQVGIRKDTKYSNLRFHYTWSKSLDTISSDGNSFVTPADSRNPDKNKAFSDFDRTRVFNLAWNYAIPFGRTQSGDSDKPTWISYVLGGWNVGLLYIWESGARFSVNSGRQNQFAGVSSLANFSGDRNMGGIYQQYGVFHWFSPDQTRQFTYPDAGEVSTSGRNSFTGPSFSNFDLMFQKKFLVHENRGLQFRIEAFNLLNHTRLANPNANLYDVNFGVISSTQGKPRRMQIGLKYQF
jgi:hypothetical protein